MVDIFLHFVKLFTIKLRPLIISFNFSVKGNNQLSKKYKTKLKRDTQADKTVFTLAQSLTGCQTTSTTSTFEQILDGHRVDND